MSTTTTTSARTRTAPPRSRARRARARTVLAAAGAGLLGWLVAGPLGGVDLSVRQGGSVSEIGPAAVVIAGVVAGLAGWAALAGLERITGRARAAWTMIAVLVLVVSLVGPLAATTATAQVSLAGLHLIVGAVVIGGLRRTARSR